MHIISMKQLREQFEPIRDGLARGESYLLMYRSKPLATLLPYEQSTDLQALTSTQPKQFTPTSDVTSQQQAETIAQPVIKTSPQLQKFGLKKMLSP